MLEAYPLSRKSSTNTVTQVATPSPTHVQQSPTDVRSSLKQRRQSRETYERSVETSPRFGKPALEKVLSDSSAIDSASSSSESEEQSHISRSRTFARRPRYAAARSTLNPLADTDEDEDTPLFLPFSDAKTTSPSPQPDPGATVRISPKYASKWPVSRLSTRGKPVAPVQTVWSSSSSSQSQPQLQNPSSRNQPSPNQSLQTRPSALSPKQRRLAKEAGSDGTPSMGSSFSDLDDASVTQSALEEALAGEMQHGGMASRMSTISQALRSRIL